MLLPSSTIGQKHLPLTFLVSPSSSSSLSPTLPPFTICTRSPPTSAAEHFRSGTLSWRPVSASTNRVKFYMSVAFQRDNEWGKYFRTQWSTGPAANPVWQDAGSCYDESSCCRVVTSGGACTATPGAVQRFSDESTTYAGYLIKFGAGNGYYPLTNHNDTMCRSPFDTGDRPTCQPGGAAAVERVDPFGVAIPFDADPSTTRVPCEAEDDHDPDYCSPWSSTYGMFYGDGTYGDVTLTVTGVEHDPSLDGNLVFASGSWQGSVGLRALRV